MTIIKLFELITNSEYLIWNIYRDDMLVGIYDGKNAIDTRLNDEIVLGLDIINNVASVYI